MTHVIQKGVERLEIFNTGSFLDCHAHTYALPYYKLVGIWTLPVIMSSDWIRPQQQQV